MAVPKAAFAQRGFEKNGSSRPFIKEPSALAASADLALGPAMFVSILHRATGNGLAVAGLGVLLWWLGALASGPEAYESFSGHASSWYGMVVLVGISWSFFNHMASGIRHFVLDIGAGYELNNNALWSMLTPVIGIVLTAAFWAALLAR